MDDPQLASCFTDNGERERARDWPKVSSCVPSSFPDFTAPAAPSELGKTFRDIPGEDSWKAGRASAVMVW